MRIPLVLRPTLTDRTKPGQGWGGVGRVLRNFQTLVGLGREGGCGDCGESQLGARQFPRTHVLRAPPPFRLRVSRCCGRGAAWAEPPRAEPGRSIPAAPSGLFRATPGPTPPRAAHASHTGTAGPRSAHPVSSLRPGARRAPRTCALLLGARSQWHKFGVPGTELALLGRPWGERSRRAPRC